MKKTIIVFACLLSLCFCYSQELKAKITYKAVLNNENYKNRIFNDTTIEDEIKKNRLKDISLKKPINFHLLIQGNQALYKAVNDMYILLNDEFNMTNVIAQAEIKYYTNLKTEEKFFQSYFRKDILVDLDEVDWTLTQETKKIGEYTCYKATTNIDSEQLHEMNFANTVVAWYTPEIPTTFGIKTFNGLPGLTLELTTNLESGIISYKATEIELNPEKEFIIEKPKAQRHISEREYIELINNLTNTRKEMRNND